MEWTNGPSNFLHTDRHNPSYFDVTAHLGEVVDFCVPVNPYFPSQGRHDVLVKTLPKLLKY